jgi:hypothetical protein
LINISCKRITIPFNVSFFRCQFVHYSIWLVKWVCRWRIVFFWINA